MMMSEENKQISAALAKLRLPEIKKNAENPYYRARYADLASIIAAIGGPLAEVQIRALQSLRIDVGHIVCATRLLHASGEWYESTVAMPIPDGDTPRDRGADADGAGRKTQATPQKYGSAITYARRYGIQAALCIAAEDDDDAANATVPARASQSTQYSPTQDRSPAASEKQVSLIKRLAIQRHGQHAEKYCAGVLSAKGLTSLDALTINQASKWIETLRTEVKTINERPEELDFVEEVPDE